MGTWGAAIFADDFALDVRERYLERLADGEDATAAARALIDELGADGEQVDDDKGPLFWLALAAVQWEYGALDDEVKRRALAILDGGGDSPLWTEPGTDKRRVAVLAALAKRLRTPPPRARRPRRRKPVELPSRSLDSPDGSACASVFVIGDLAQVAIEIRSLGGGGGVFAAQCALDDVQLRWLDDATLEIAYPSTARQVSRGPIGSPDRFFLSGRTIALRFRTRRA